MLCVIAKTTRDGDWPAATLMDEVAVAALAAAIDKASLFQFRYQITYLRRQAFSKLRVREFAQA
ncbi:MAG: hypothetical protein P9C36_01825 [Defluviicoccus sp.]|nr:hypothetical protein [Defluviicoccus sp.]MDG4591347.1 hypothetical protein [Defluviicoccus sp.]